MKKTLQKVAKSLGRRRQPRSEGTPTWSKTRTGGPPKQTSADVTGQTIFDDRPLRFRNLTTAQVDLRALEIASHSADVFKIRVAKFPGTRREARVLVERRYSQRGYEVPAPSNDPYLFTFLAYDEGQIVGTVAVRLDSSQGLAADDLYREEINQLRADGKRVCEFTRLAVDSAIASKPILAGLFHTAYLYAAVVSGFTHAVIEVNPRHVAYYGKALKFMPIGPQRMNERVMAPAVLLCVPFATISEGVARFAGRPDVAGAKSSLFLYGFSPNDESGVLQRLRTLLHAA